ncbi:putative UDP-glucose dehydrogenase Ugd1 [Aspergillus stella-maris]|uniref:putative UDP-glucose dehydrogenase Ugd1 n=1 Tax=Aspergillus stella-maris TaxID=1810926 RepID=UPI003CCD7FD5
MFFFIPIVFVLAGVGLLFAHRRYKGLRGKEQAKPIVAGHTYSESIEKRPSQELRETKVENVRRCCIVGAGRLGALTAVTLAKHNPDIEFSVVDRRKDLIKAWNSDDLPIAEAGLEEIFFDDAYLDGRAESTAAGEQEPSSPEALVYHSERRRKLPNLAFSMNVHAGVASADVIFLCVEMESTQPGNGESTVLDHSYLNPILRIIANNSTRHKIIVQRAAAPYGVTQYITNNLKANASPTASFTVLANPSFTLPKASIHEIMVSDRVIIGHLYSPETSEASITALKRLYTSWIPEENIVTMDAWSVELGRIASKALLAQQMASIESIRTLCAKSEASASNVGWMLGIPNFGEGHTMRCGALQNEVQFLTDVITQSGLGSIASYWDAIGQVDQIQRRRTVEQMLAALPESMDSKRIAVVGTKDPAISSFLLKRLRDSGAWIQVWNGDGSSMKTQGKRMLRDSGDTGRDDTIPGSLEEACSGCCAVLVQGYLRMSDEAWQRVAAAMEEPKMLLSMGDGVDRVKMKQLGFKTIEQ